MKSHSSVWVSPARWKRIFGFASNVVNADRFRFEENFAAGSDPRSDQVFDDFMLRVNGDGFAAGQVGEVDAMAGATEAQLDSVMHQAFALQPIAYAGLDIRSTVPCLEHAGTDAMLEYSCARLSRTTDSIPCKWSKCASISPAGPAPIIPT